MKNKKLWIVLAIALVAVLAAATVITVLCCQNKVTVTFESNGGNKVEPIVLKKGEKLTSLPQSYLVGSSFNGWFTDADLSQEFKADTAINEDITLYASFTESEIDMNLSETTAVYSENVSRDHSIKFTSERAYSAEEFLDRITIEAVSGFLPWEVADQLVDEVPKDIYGWFDVGIDGSTYTLTPKAIEYDGELFYAYNEGHLYKITVSDGIRFADLSDNVLDYTFRIDEELKDNDINNIQYKDTDNLRFIKKENIKNIDDITEISDEENMLGEQTAVTSLAKDESGYYTLLFTKENYDRYGLSAGNILCIGDSEEMRTDSLYVKIEEIIEQEQSTGTEYLVLAVDADVSDVFDEIDVNFNQPISNGDIIAGLDTEEIKNTIETNGSLEKVTNIVTNLIYVSDEAQAVYNAERINTQELAYSTALPDFCSNTSITNEKKLLNASLLKGAQVTITVGEGHNPNFDKAYTDKFVALQITFTYSATIKNKLDVNAEIVFTQYLAVSAQGRLDYEKKHCVVQWLDFDYALNIYSQTDFDFKILVRTVKPDGNKDNKFIDISEKIAEKLQNEDGEDPNNLVAELREMLQSENGYIELFRAPIIRIPIDIIPALPVMQVRVELDFLVEMNFAAGFSAHMSVLEAVQVGVTGNTRTKEMTSYKNELPGGNQYAMQLSACGYLGFRAGFKGGLSVSFCGLSDLGKVGVYAFVGPYVDIYAFAQATLIKENANVRQSLVGGYYIEIGLFLEISLEARSDLFGVKIGAVLYDNKWPLVTFGNKNVLVSIETSEMETVYIENKGETTASIDVTQLPPLKGTYIDITTGETSVQDIPWDKISLHMSERNFEYDYSTQVINYENFSIPKPASETCIATYYYNGSIMQFNMTSAQYQDYYPFAQTKIVYYDSTQIEKEDAGQLVDVTVYSCIDGKKEVMREAKVYTGKKFRDYTPLDPYKYTNINWDTAPNTTVITERSEFTCYAETRQAYAAFIYYDIETDSWITEIRACDLGETPITPDVTSKGKVSFDKWIGYNGVNNHANNTPQYGVGTMITPKDIRNHGYFVETTSGHDPSESVAKYITENSNHIVLFDELFNNTSESGRAWYYNMTSIYVASYNYDSCKVTVHSSDADGNKMDDVYSVPYGRELTTLTIHSPLSQKFLGYALEEGGEIVYRSNAEVGSITEDTELYAVFGEKRYKVNLYYWDGIANEYKLYNSYDLLGGKTLESIDLEGAKSAIVKDSGKDYEFWYFADQTDGKTTYLNSNTMCTRDLNVYPVYGREITVTFLCGDGFFPFDKSSNETVLYTEAKLNYKLTSSIVCIKSSTDKYSYNLIGWKNVLTGEEILLNDPSGFEFTFTCDTPSTFVAMFEEVLRKDYSITIRTAHGTLKNGEKEIVLTNVDYDTFISIKNEYSQWVPSKVHDSENHCTYVYRGSQSYPTQTSYTREYIYWDKQIDKHTITINANGGSCTGSTAIEKEWNTQIDLSELVVTKEDDSTVWKILNFVDEAGNVYGTDSTYLVKADGTLTVNWEVDFYKEYTVTLELDGEVIDTKSYHKNDTLADFAKPEEADGKVFSGWTWYDSNGNTIDPVTEMPAEDLTLRGTSSEVYIKYFVDGKEMIEYRAVGRVGYTETVKDMYEKEGYTVQPWSASSIEISGGKFTMPEHDVIFTATTVKNSYTVTYYHNGSIYGEVKTVPYGEYVLLAHVPTVEGQYLAWSSDDITINGTGFTMPAHNVTITSITSETKQHIIYYVNDEIIGYDTAIPGQELQVRYAPTDAKYNGMTFSGWYCGNTALEGGSTFEVGNGDVHIYGYYTSGAVKVNIYFSETNTSPDIVLYGDVGDSISITAIMDKLQISGYKVNGELGSAITVTDGSTEISAYVQYVAKTYKLSYYCDYYVTLPDDAYYNAGEQVYLTDAPSLDSYTYVEFYSWITTEAEILKDSDGRSYFIMPERDVAIYALCGIEYDPDETSKTASVYINSPYSSEPIFLRDHTVIDGYNISFAVPPIEGYEFVGWKDENGNIVADEYSGIYLDDMNGEDCCFYGEYRKLELHMIEFRINNVVVGYQTFYDSSMVITSAPTVELADGEVFSGWMNLYVNPYTGNMFLSLSESETKRGSAGNNVVSFSTGDSTTHEYAGMDFIFNGYIYNEENAYSITVEYPAGDDYNLLYQFYTNENAVINLSAYENGEEYTYALNVTYSYPDNGSYKTETVWLNDAVMDNDQYTITIPSLSSIQEVIGAESEVSYFTILASPKDSQTDDAA